MNEEPKKENKAEAAVAGQASFLLTKEQKKRLILVAQDAWSEQKRVGMCDDTFEVFRRGALFDVCSKTSFRSVMQGEYLDAINYFRKLAGKQVEPKQVKRASTAEDERRRALYSLKKECENLADRYGGAGGAAVYADALFQGIHKCGQDKASAKQIWNVIFTLRNRNKTKGAK